MDKLNLKDKVILYGNGLIPLHMSCNYCYHFNYECEGSVYREECPIGQLSETDLLENKILSRIAKDVDFNNALLGLIVDTIDSTDLKLHLEELYKLIEEELTKHNIQFDIMKLKDNRDLVDDFDISNKGYIKANLRTIENIEYALSLPKETIEELRKKYNLI